jgi:hypothetical protein
VGLVGCGGSDTSTNPDDAATQVKAPIRGLIDMQNIAWHNTDEGHPDFVIDNVERFPEIFGGIVINAAWSDIQPLDTPGRIDFGVIDYPLNAVSAYNLAHPTAPLGVKLRVYAGSTTPDWAKRIGGGPVMLFRNPQGCASGSCPITVGKYWTPEFIARWRAFQALLAARYDADPIVRQVAVTSCAPQTDEPFVPSTDPQARANVRAAGYTDDAQRSCLMGAIEDYAAWKLTLVDYTINPFNSINGGSDTAFPLAVMRQCRAVLGERCVLGNHSLSAEPRTNDAALYEAMQTLGAPINFQTEAPRAMDCLWTSTIARGVAYGATAIEIWPEARFQGFMSLSVPNVVQLARQFTAPIPVPNIAPPPAPCSGFR